MSRITEKKMLNNLRTIREKNPDYVCSTEELMYDKLGQLEDLMEKYGIENIEELEDTIKVKKALELAFGKRKG